MKLGILSIYESPTKAAIGIFAIARMSLELIVKPSSNILYMLIGLSVFMINVIAVVLVDQRLSLYFRKKKIE